LALGDAGGGGGSAGAFAGTEATVVFVCAIGGDAGDERVSPKNRTSHEAMYVGERSVRSETRRGVGGWWFLGMRQVSERERATE